MSSKHLVFVLVLLLAATCTATAQYLQITERHGLGPNPYAITSADLDGDGFTDFAIADYSVSDVYIFVGDGHGSFSHFATIDGGMSLVKNIYAADLDGDADMDLMICGLGEEFHLIVNNGDGTFAAPVAITGTTHPHSLCWEDFDNDGHLDLAVGCWALAGYINLYFGNGDATFQNPVTIYDDSRVTTIATDDLDNDGDPDLAFCGQLIVRTMFNNGDGTFAAPDTVGTLPGWEIRRMHTVDFNHDGSPDILFSHWGESVDRHPYTALNYGDGSFEEPEIVVGGWWGCADAIGGDFNMDGYQDVLYCAKEGDAHGWLTIHHNDGTSDFSDMDNTEYFLIPNVGADIAALVAGDFDFDSDLDLAVVSDSLVIIENTSMLLDFTMTPNPAYPTVPPGGGTFTFAVTLTNNSPYNLVVRGQTEAVLPNGNTVQDYLRNGLQLNAGATLQFNTLPVTVPPVAPPGVYRYWGIITVTNPPVQLQVRDWFDFEKLSGE